MLKLFGIIILIVIFMFFINNKIRIKWKTFFKKGFKPSRNKFGIYCYCGKQGKGKTYSAVEFLLENKDKKIYSNLGSLQGVEYTRIYGFDDLLALRNEHDCIIFFDEIFTALTRQSRVTTDVLDFLSQMRKRHIILITTAQEWLEINMTFRRYCRYQIDCNMFPFLNTGFLIKTFRDAELMKWSQNDNEYVAPLVETTFSKCNLEVAQSYDTFETISSNFSSRSSLNGLKKGTSLNDKNNTSMNDNNDTSLNDITIDSENKENIDCLNDKAIDSSNNKINSLSNDKKSELSKKNVLDLFNKKRGGVK